MGIRPLACHKQALGGRAGFATIYPNNAGVGWQAYWWKYLEFPNGARPCSGLFLVLIRGSVEPKVRVGFYRHFRQGG